jgi:hypothetical protein
MLIMAQQVLSLANLQAALAQNNTKMKDWVTSKVNDVEIFTIEWVQELPTENISTSTIYMIKNEKDSVDENNIYTEYVYNSTDAKWEIIGRVEAGAVDLTGFYTKVEVDKMLENYYTKTEIDKMFEGVYTKEEVYSKEETYAKTEVYSKEETYAKADVYTKEETYAKDDVYTKTEADELLADLVVEDYESQEITDMITGIWSE